MFGAGRRPRDNPDPLVLELWIVDRGDILKTAAGLEDQRIGRPVIGDRHLRLIVALRKSHDDIASERAQRHPDEAGCLREVGVAELLAELGGEQFGELVFKSLALVVGERQIARIATGAKDVGIDEFERAGLACLAWALGLDRPQGDNPQARSRPGFGTIIAVHLETREAGSLVFRYALKVI